MFFCVQQHAHLGTCAYCQLRSPPCTTTVTAHSGNCLYLHCLQPLQFDRSELEVARYLLATGIIFYLALWPVTWKRIVASVNADYRNRFAIAIWACCPAAVAIALQAIEGPSALTRYGFLAGVGLTVSTLAAVYPYNFFMQGTFNMRCVLLLLLWPDTRYLG
jgi:hypothetical protein